MPEPIEIPTFTYGTYQSLEGESVTFDHAFLSELVANTNKVIAAKALTPPVGYDEIDATGAYRHRGTEAHAHVIGAKLRNGVVSLVLDKPSETFRKDVREGRRLRVSGEYARKLAYTDGDGKKVEVGPTIIGLAALGRARPALKNPKIVPLADLNFGDGVDAISAANTREELRACGFVAHTLDEDKYSFSEIAIDPRRFSEEENGMDTKEIQALIDAAVAPLKTQVATLQTENTTLKGDVQRFSETSKREGDTRSFCETLQADRKAAGSALPKLFIQEGEAILNDPSFSDGHRERVKKLMTLAPAALITKPTKGAAEAGEGNGSEGDDDDEPQALAALKPRHFADITANEEAIAAGLTAFSEFRPDAVKDLSHEARMRKLQTYVRTRDLGDKRADA